MSRSPASGWYGAAAMRPLPRGRAGPRRATSSTSRPARRRASSRSPASVARVMSASRAIASSASSAMASSNAASSSWPTAGDTSSKFGRRDSARRDTVERLASSMAAAACGPSFRKGKPPSGPGLFPSTRRRRVGRVGDPEDLGPQLGDDLLRRAQAPLAQPHPAGQRHEHGVEPDRRRRHRLLAQRRQRRTTAVASSAPRTDEPTRRSGWVRVRRTSSTICSTHAASAPSTARATIAASSPALW